jgi:phage-related holin
MMLLVGIDTFFGVWLGLKRKSFSSRRFGDAIKKLITYFLVMLASNAVSVHLVGDTVNYTLSWVNHAVYSLILARELLSIFEKTHLLGYFTLPKWLEEKFEAFENQQPSKNTDGKN